MTGSLQERAETIVTERIEQARLRSLDARSSAQQVNIAIDGRSYVNFASNDYLGLAAHARVRAAAQEAIARYGAGSGASPLLSGRTKLHAELEYRLADFLQREAALCFSTGYSANIGVIEGLVKRGDVVMSDRLNHASLIDGVRLSGARSLRYAHADTDMLERRLEDNKGCFCWVLSDGVFSMDGDIAPLQQLIKLTQRYAAILMIDDAHGIGALGAKGRGSLELINATQNDVPLLVGTLGKALGSAGAFVAGSRDLIQALVQVARPYIYSTAMPPASAAAAIAALDIIKNEPERRARLAARTQFFREQANEAGLPISASTTPVQPVMIGSDRAAVSAAEQLGELGFYVRAIRAPTVRPGTARLRISLCADHREDQIAGIVEATSSIWSSM